VRRPYRDDVELDIPSRAGGRVARAGERRWPIVAGPVLPGATRSRRRRLYAAKTRCWIIKSTIEIRCCCVCPPRYARLSLFCDHSSCELLEACRHAIGSVTTTTESSKKAAQQHCLGWISLDTHDTWLYWKSLFTKYGSKIQQK